MEEIFLTRWTVWGFSRSTQLHQDTILFQHFPVWACHLANDIWNAMKHCIPTLWLNKNMRLLVSSHLAEQQPISNCKQVSHKYTFTLWCSSISHLTKHHNRVMISSVKSKVLILYHTKMLAGGQTLFVLSGRMQKCTSQWCNSNHQQTRHTHLKHVYVVLEENHTMTCKVTAIEVWISAASVFSSLT